ncbi:MAG: isopentenyl phosphate kinase [Candidatus Bathyarchaeota archaeon]
MSKKPTILKLGGSVITDKEKPLTPNLKAIGRLADEIFRAKTSPLILVHGGGSFGHPVAEQYGIANGYVDSSQILGFAATHLAMTLLNSWIMESLISRNIPAVEVNPSSCLLTNNGRIKIMELKPLTRMLKMGIIPVLYGDAVPDQKKGFSILSGDQIVSWLAIIEELKNLKNNIGGSKATDVTGGMFGKMNEVTLAINHEIETIIVNANVSETIYKALTGEEVLGTVIKKG